MPRLLPRGSFSKGLLWHIFADFQGVKWGPGIDGRDINPVFYEPRGLVNSGDEVTADGTDLPAAISQPRFTDEKVALQWQVLEKARNALRAMRESR